MNVVPFKKYGYDDWCAIAHQNNVMRRNKSEPDVEANEIWQLWQAFFCEAA